MFTFSSITDTKNAAVRILLSLVCLLYKLGVIRVSDFERILNILYEFII